MGLQVGRVRSQPNINVTPLVDIVLVLLIVFIVLVPAVEVKLPRARHSQSTEGAEALKLTLQKDGRVRAEQGSLAPRLLSIEGTPGEWQSLGSLRDRRVLVFADAGRTFHDIGRLFDRLREQDAGEVQCITSSAAEGGVR